MSESIEKEGKRGYKFIDDLTSDVFFEAWGETAEDMFISAAEALMDVEADTKKIKPKKSFVIKAEGKDMEDLMFNWLQAVIQTVEIEESFYFMFEIQKFKEGKLIEAMAWGEDMKKELGGTHVKGVTLYKFSVKKDRDVWKTTVSLDI